ncbi:hypothetical protein HGRIS_000074 [Hohenbuehelia grisea]|uniref:Uncharacterized protein n=1 Tax=Hohenbuehelia grisea TaxID=104357 RepID=A0ABR3JRI3_9AGAR
MSLSMIAIITLVFSSVVNAASYRLSDNIVGNAFANAFDYEAIQDPTHGRVNYVDGPTARRLNLTYTSANTIILRADHTTRLNSGGPGRNSVRVRSKKAYRTHVAV